MNQDYVDTVRLLLAIAPLVFKPSHFALKGGTALNLFVQDSHDCPSTLMSYSPTTRSTVNPHSKRSALT